MRIQLILIATLFLNIAHASSEKAMRNLFIKYDAVMLRQQTQYVDEIFSAKFLESHGGKEEFIAMIKELPNDSSKSFLPPIFSWRKTNKADLFFATLKPLDSAFKSNDKEKKSGTQFIIVKEKGKLKIEGTVSDAH